MASRTDFEIGFRRYGPARKRSASSLRIVVLGDFSGRESRGVLEALTARRPLGVDVDRLERVMSRLEPSVRIHAGSDVESSFVLRDLDDLHPDQIFANCELFSKLQDLRARLRDSSTFDAAASELRASSTATVPDGPTAAAASTADETAGESDVATVERLLGARPTERGAPKAAGIADAFLREIVAPYIVPDPDPRQEIYVAAIEEAIAAEMRRFLRDPYFGALETLWRSLHRLVTEIDIDEGYEIQIVDVSWPELERDARDAAGELDRSALHRVLRDDSDEAASSVIVGAYAFGPDDARVLALLGAVASDLGAPFLAAAKPQLLGVSSFADLAHHEAAADTPDGEEWEALRASPLATGIGLVLPGVLARLPYGAKTDPIDAFPFEELEDPNDLRGLLWGNAAFVCAELIAGVFAEEGSVGLPPAGSEVEDLPAFVFSVDGERRLLPCAQVLLSDANVEAILSQGLVPLVSHRSRNVVRVERMVSLSGADFAGS